MRSWLKDQYHRAPKWVAKVDKMADPQVMAVYFRMTAAKRK